MYTTTRNPKDAIAEGKNAANNVAETARETVIEMKDDLRSIANSAGRKVRSFIDTTSSEVSHATEVVTKQIKDKPVQSSLIALGAGFLLGALLRR